MLLERLNVLLPMELALWLKMEAAEFLVVAEPKRAAVCETLTWLCDTGSTLVTAWDTGSTK